MFLESEGVLSETTVHNVISSGLSVFKVNEKGLGLPGAGLSIFADDGTLVEHFTSDGTIHEVKVKPGIYHIRETDVPTNYFGMKEDLYVRVDRLGDLYTMAGDKIDTARVVNDTTHVRVYNNLPGVEQAVYPKDDVDENGQPKPGAVPVDTFASGEEPHDIDELPPGEYVVLQTKVPDGYNNDGPKPFTVPESSELVHVYLNNYRTEGTVTIHKYNENDEYLSGAEFTITGTTDEGAEIEPVVFVTDGKAQSFTLHNGDYVLTETKAPKGYGKAVPITFRIVEGMLELDNRDTGLSGNQKLVVNHDTPAESVGNIVVYNHPKVGSLRVGKKVIGNAADKTRSFPFRLTLSSLPGQDASLPCIINGEPETMTFQYSEETGSYTAEFPMKDGDVVDLPNIGAHYKVEELDPGHYTVSYENAEGDAVSEDMECMVTNAFDLGIPTGVIPGLGYGICVLGLLGLICLLEHKFRK